MDILKYFYEEPASLEVLSPDTNPDARRQHGEGGSLEAFLQAPRYHRGYLAGTNLLTGMVGLTALNHPEAFTRPLLDWLEGARWTVGYRQGNIKTRGVAQIKDVMRQPQDIAVLVCANTNLPGEHIAAVTGTERRHALSALRVLLDEAEVVFFPEPAHHGFDWSFFSRQPMRDALVAAMQRYPAEGVRRFVVPFQRARSEHKFYFETWQLDQPLPDYIEEL